MNSTNYPKAELKWPVSIKTAEPMDGVTTKLNPNGAFISCSRPLRLYDKFDITIDVPSSDGPLEARVEVVFSNIYGPDDDITPRGMGVRFINMSSKDRQFIAKEVLKQLKLKEVDARALKGLQTIAIDEEGTVSVAV
jgi:PilZ domain